MRRLFALRRDTRGAAAIEMGLALPTLLVMFFGIFQFGATMWAEASLANAVGEAARYATIYPTPTDAQIEDFARNSQLGIDASRLRTVSAVRGTDAGRPYVDVTLTLDTSLNFVFFEGPDITLSETRRAYLAGS